MASKNGSASRNTSASSNAQPQRSNGGAKSAKVRFAVVGLGHIAQAAVLPAFAHAKKSAELAALVSDDPRKLSELGKRYGVSALYDYDGFLCCLEDEGINAVYIATPNSEHLPFARDAAEAGVHVLCEKPLGVTERECLAIIEACERAKVRLMTAYRLHFEVANLKAIEMVRSGTIGKPRIFSSVFSYPIKDRGNIRLRAELGGGPLHDIGIYCINAARSVFRAEPIEVQGWAMHSDDPRFEEVEEGISAQLRFPGGGLATFVCSFGVSATGWYQVVGTKGDVCVDPAYEYTEGLGLTLTVDDKSRERTYAKRDQFAAEITYFADCVLNKKEPEPSGWEGLADVRVIRAIQQSIDRGRALEVPPMEGLRYPKPSQRIDRPPVPREPKLVRARSAS